jgi:phage terminase large subunit
MLSRKVRVLCARELMHSLRESVHHLLVAKIEALGLSRYFEVLDREISCPLTRSEAIFAGLHTNVRQLASLEAVGLCWIEEAESISKESLEVLTPTIRLPGSEIWFSLNPDEPAAPVQAFADGARPDTRRIHVVFTDNPFLTPTLDAERSYLQRVDPDAYAHVWLGQTRSHSDAAVFAGKYQVEEFTPVPEPPEGASIHPKRVGSLKFWQGPYFGADWGFSQDPTTLVKCWIYERTLYIEHEAWAIGCDLDKTPALFDTVPGARLHTVRADNARPETISYLRRNGFPRLAAVEKWKNSATDGVAYLRSYERIVIHPRCTHTIEEFRLYSYRVDRLTGDVQPELLDLHNHCIDALRYALAPAIRNRGRGRIVPLRV